MQVTGAGNDNGQTITLEQSVLTCATLMTMDTHGALTRLPGFASNVAIIQNTIQPVRAAYLGTYLLRASPLRMMVT